ncbi:hypothetical protein TGME49_250905 [Toxoplasma gondii ME49]|uniref:Uncharacterized protein n=1 Tax=Toxoplasma gondii (strain ATCC 50611 / Me49) TaxID=508771 RepID=S8ESC7_TOXGM|nr:hypothetical protein TGME49_250905 [Toxoplasma gondii ME49]EPT25197.1 hypothetical protein TGME49_250905 [Toxoplasma gondii ME49]|eukprot:XP_018635079.1 hypothetical protein TGME49_250905 [Toxoplasma gondii ME49]
MSATRARMVESSLRIRQLNSRSEVSRSSRDRHTSFHGEMDGRETAESPTGTVRRKTFCVGENRNKSHQAFRINHGIKEPRIIERRYLTSLLAANTLLQRGRGKLHASNSPRRTSVEEGLQKQVARLFVARVSQGVLSELRSHISCRRVDTGLV